MPLTSTLVEDAATYQVFKDVFTDAAGKVEAVGWRTEPKVGTTEEVARDLRQKADAARAANRTYLNTALSATVNNARVAALETQVARLTRQVNALIGLILEAPEANGT